MSLFARQITLVGNAAAVPALVQGSTGSQFKNIAGSVQDPLPVTIKNEDAALIVWVGGSDADATHGQSLAAGASMTFNLYGNDIPFLFSTGAPIVSVLVGRQ